MENHLIAVLIGTIVVVAISMNLMCAELSPQHAEFLKTFFWDFPCVLIERVIPVFGS